MKKKFTISIFTDHKAGLLSRVTIVFTRRKINIFSITASESEVKGIHRYTILVEETEELVQKVVKQLEKQVDIYKAFYHSEEQVVYQEIALYKILTSSLVQGGSSEILIRKHNARILTVEPDFTIIEKTGHQEETQALFDELASYGTILEFVRSGRVAISKPMKELKDYLSELAIEAENK